MEIKTGIPQPWYRLQVVAYESTFLEAPRLLLLYLKSTRSYTLIELCREEITGNVRMWESLLGMHSRGVRRRTRPRGNPYYKRFSL